MLRMKHKQFLGHRVRIEVRYLNIRRKLYSLFDCDHVDGVTLSLKFVQHRSDLAGFGRRVISDVLLLILVNMRHVIIVMLAA